MIKTATALLGAAILLAGVPATAEPAGSDLVSVTRQVRVSDLDLFSAKDRRILDERIAAAARAVCRADRLSLMREADLECRDQAIASAHRQRDRLLALRGIVGDFRSAGIAR